MMKSKDLFLSLRLALQAMAILSNFNSIVSFSDSDFGQLLTLYDVKGLIFFLPNIGDQVPQNDQGKGVENLFGLVENIVEVQNMGNAKDKALENLIGDKYAFIDITILLENSFVDKTTKIFTEWSECQYCSPIVIFSVDWH